jgi:hypothetical protein
MTATLIQQILAKYGKVDAYTDDDIEGVVTFLLSVHAVRDALDVLAETGLDTLHQLVLKLIKAPKDAKTLSGAESRQVIEYLLETAQFRPIPEAVALHNTVCVLQLHQGQPVDALLSLLPMRLPAVDPAVGEVAYRDLGGSFSSALTAVLEACEATGQPAYLQQAAIVLARHGLSMDPEPKAAASEATDSAMTGDARPARPSAVVACSVDDVCPLPAAYREDKSRAQIQRAAMGAFSQPAFAALSAQMDLTPPKAPEDVYRTDMEDVEVSAEVKTNFLMRLADAYVSGFVNFASGQDVLLAPKYADAQPADAQPAREETATVVPATGTPAAPATPAPPADTAPAVEAPAAEAPAPERKLVSGEGYAVLRQSKHSAKLSAAGTVGLVHAWGGLDALNAASRYTHNAAEERIACGARFAMAVASSRVRDPHHAALAVIASRLCPGAGVETAKALVYEPTLSALGVGIAYAGTRYGPAADLLIPLVTDPNSPLAVASQAALALGLIYLGTGDRTAADLCLSALKARDGERLATHHAVRFVLQGAALVYFGTGRAVEGLVSSVRRGRLGDASTAFLDPIFAPIASAIFYGYAYYGTGDMRLVQGLLQDLAGAQTAWRADSAAREAEREAAADRGHSGTSSVGASAAATTAHGSAGSGAASGSQTPPGVSVAPSVAGPSRRPARQRPAPEEDKNKEAEELDKRTVSDASTALVMAISQILSTADDVTPAMALRLFERMFQFGTVPVRGAVPLAIALLFPSTGDISLCDVLQRMAHDPVPSVATGAILAIGIVGAGTNNARFAAALHALVAYHFSSPRHIFTVRLSQGLLALGKGLLALSTRHGLGQVVLPAAACGLSVLLHSVAESWLPFLNTGHHRNLFLLALATRPRGVVALDHSGAPLDPDQNAGLAGLVGTANEPLIMSAAVGYRHDHKARVATSLGSDPIWETCSDILEDVIVAWVSADSVAAAID